jgi:PPK2 family polyphosphate:nucleotide phosphotransferase
MTSQKKSGWEADPAPLLRVGDGFTLDAVDANGSPGFVGNKAAGKAELNKDAELLSEKQERLFAASKGEATDAVLLVLQAMDTAGKGGIVRHVVGSVDPQGVALSAFKAPTEEELSHDFLWRIKRAVPEPGLIGVFDRSHYEDVLIARVRGLADDVEIERRYGAILEFEQELVDRGIRIVKVMLHISADEQKARLAQRLDRPDKHWKFNPGDIDERQHWSAYQDAYQAVFERTSSEAAPWHVVPANKKWYARVAVQRLLLDALTEIDPQWPPGASSAPRRRSLRAATAGRSR